MQKPSRSGSQKRQTQQRNVALYQADIEDVETIRRIYGLDSFSQAIRKAIRMASENLQKKAA